MLLKSNISIWSSLLSQKSAILDQLALDKKFVEIIVVFNRLLAGTYVPVLLS
jgi:hypothetical protein